MITQKTTTYHSNLHKVKLISIEITTKTIVNQVNNFYSFKHKTDRKICKGLVDIVMLNEELDLDTIVGLYKQGKNSYRRDYFQLNNIILIPISAKLYLKQAEFLYNELRLTSDVNKLRLEAEKIQTFLKNNANLNKK